MNVEAFFGSFLERSAINDRRLTWLFRTPLPCFRLMRRAGDEKRNSLIQSKKCSNSVEKNGQKFNIIKVKCYNRAEILFDARAISPRSS